MKTRTYTNKSVHMSGDGRTGTVAAETAISLDELIDRLNEDLAREYQAIIAYVVYSQVIKGPEYMKVAGELKQHARQELEHALTIAKLIDYLGGMPTAIPEPVKITESVIDLLRFDLANENTTIRNYRERVYQCEALGHFGMAEQIRKIMADEQEHQIDLATALGEHVAALTVDEERA